MTYPVNDSLRPSHMTPASGNLYPEERELLEWIKQSEYRFADLEEETEHEWWRWADWVVPLAYLYNDYRRWKLRHLYSEHDPDAPQLLTSIAFSVALRWVVMPDLNEPVDGVNRRVVVRRVCNRTSKRRAMRMLRGVKHPDGYHLHGYPGRPTNDHIAPLQD